MHLTFCFTIICLMQILPNTNAKTGKYTVIAPDTIQCNEKYTAAVAVHHTTQPCQLKVGIVGSSYTYFHQIEVAQNEVKNVEFILPCCEKGDFYLIVEALDCLENFRNTTKLFYNEFNNHVIIQTDKDFYAPGEDINFRVLFLDKDFRPARQKKDALIWIADGKRNRVKEINNFKTIKGVYSGKFKISELCVRGSWQLGVKNDGGFPRAIHLEVDNYVLPRFLVQVYATQSVSVKDGVIQVIVRANYNYGKRLDGNVTVILFLEYFNHYRGVEPPVLTKTADMVEGKAKLDLNVKEYDAYLSNESSPLYLTIVATVEEKITGIKINGTSHTTLYSYRYAMNCIDYNAFATFEVGKEKDVLFQITYIDGSYPNDTKSTIELIYKEVLRKNRWWHHGRILDDDDSNLVTGMVPPPSENRTMFFKGNMNETGFVTFKVALPHLTQYEGYLHYYSLELKYLDEQHEVCNTHLYWDQKQVYSPKKEEEKSKEYFILEDKNFSATKLYLKHASQFTLNSSRHLSYFDYNIIGRGNILKSGRVILPDKPKSYNLTLTPQFSWAPIFCVYVNYIDESGKYHYVEQPYEVVLELENQINVTVVKQVKPGEEVALKIQTAQNSFVGLIAIDQTAFLLKKDNDLNFHKLSKVLRSYTTYTPPQSGYAIYPGEMSGCITLTNADYFHSRTRPKKRKREFLVVGNVDASINSTAGAADEAFHVKVPKDFLRTWIFADIENTDATEFIWSIKIPETISSWVLTAFSLNLHKGLGVTTVPTKITTFQPFFISTRLPYAVKRGEVINVPAFVFNYLNEALDVEVTLHNNDHEFEFIEFDNVVVNEDKRSKNIRVPANGAAGVSFLLKTKVLGNVMLKFIAVSPIAGDAIHKTMKVVPEGIAQYANRAYFVNLDKESEFKFSFAFEIPQDLVPDSEHVEVGVVGDILGPVLNDFDNLVHLPTGCAEQTMSTLLPNYLVMKYLKDTKRLTPAMETKLRYNLETGYQNILYYHHNDGSFSSFASPAIKEKPRTGSTWLTAYVVRSLQQIKEFVNVDSKIIEDGLIYLSKQQAANGTFTEFGDYLYQPQGNHVTVTCYAILAFLENETYAKKYSDELNKSLKFIALSIPKSDSFYAQAIATFTLNKAKHETAKNVIHKLKFLVKTGEDVESTSYVLLTLLDQYYPKIDDIPPVIKWLIAQRNSYGGFATPQDTVIGLTALIEFAKFADYERAKMNVDIKSKDKKGTIKLTKDNGILYQNLEMPPQTRSINFTATGTGSALVQIAYQYNVFKMDHNPSFTIKIMKIRKKNRPLHFEILVCLSYVGEEEFSNMAILEIYTPSGYVIDDGDLTEIKEMKIVSNTELKYYDTLLIVYFHRLYKNDLTCFLLKAIRTHAVALQKPAPIILYEYSYNSKKTTAFYEAETKLCDICETKEECSKCKEEMVL